MLLGYPIRGIAFLRFGSCAPAFAHVLAPHSRSSCRQQCAPIWGIKRERRGDSGGGARLGASCNFRSRDRLIDSIFRSAICIQDRVSLSPYACCLAANGGRRRIAKPRYYMIGKAPSGYRTGRRARPHLPRHCHQSACPTQGRGGRTGPPRR